MPSVAKIVAAMRANPRNIRYDDLAKVCEHHFGPPRTSGGSHSVFKTPWPGDPRVAGYPGEPGCPYPDRTQHRGACTLLPPPRRAELLRLVEWPS